MRSLVWLTDFDPTPNGLSRRHVHFGPMLRALGFRVHFLVPDWSYEETGLRHYVDLGIIDSFSRFKGFRADGSKGALSRLLVFPALRNLARRSRQREHSSEILRQILERQADVLMVSERRHLFSTPLLRKHTRVVIDWCDSFTLTSWRELKLAVHHREAPKLPGMLYQLAANALEESYYPRFGHANVVVSPADRRVLKSLSRASTFHVVPPGMDRYVTPPGIERVAGRMVFSGVWDFPPNGQSALWFIDTVLPLIRSRVPKAHFVVAGRRPTKELLARASDCIEVTGEVPDLIAEIAKAQLYVAPMVSGSGFKNKILEALAAGTPVVGTPLAAEFLHEELRPAVTIRDSPEALASAAVDALQSSETQLAVADRCRETVHRLYNWDRCARLMASVLAPSDDWQGNHPRSGT